MLAKAAVRNGFAMITRTGLDASNNSSTLYVLALDLGTLATVPVQLNTADTAFTAQANDVLQWVPDAQDATLSALWRYHCDTGRVHALIGGAIQLTNIRQYLGGADRTVGALIQPPAHGFEMMLGMRSESGASLVGYLADSDQLINWGSVPSPKGMQIIDLSSRDRSLQVGGNHGVLVSVQADEPQSLRVLATNLPAP